MGLNRYKLGSLITPIDERNTFGYRDFYGINIHKEFMPTVANTEGLDETKYKVVRKNRFVFSGMQTGRDQCIRISMYAGDNPIIVSPAYTTFEVTAVDIVLPMYFFMLFLSKERERLGAFYSDGSIRSNLDWERFCDIELDLPSVSVQQKYVDIYNAMIVNQQSYECGLEDLKLVCDGYIEDLRRKMTCEKIGQNLTICDCKNDIGLSVESVRGISTSKEFIFTKANMDGVSLSNYKIVKPKQIAYVADTSRRGNKISLNLFNLLCLIAFAYCVVKIFFQNIKRGGILLIQMAVGSLYMFSVPRGYTDGFVQWMKQVAAICLTAFLQTSILYLGLLTFPDNMLLGMGILLSANEVPRIAQQFGLDSSVKVNMMSVVHATTTAVNLTRSVARAVK